MSQILILGAGLVARPLVQYLLQQTDHGVTVASRTAHKAEALLQGHPRGRHLGLDVTDQSRLSAEIARHDLVISLLPYGHHPMVAKLCLEHGKHLVTTSYVSPAMRELDAEAKAKGLIFLNEIGLDPGIDHMSAMRIIHAVQAEGGEITAFTSYCGGLPAPEANDNPLGYKLSWSPRGVVMAGRNDARYRWEGREMMIPGPDLFASARQFDVPGEGTFEAYPNRNSLPYLETYGIASARTILRGTLRYPGWSQAWLALAKLGYTADEALPAGARSVAEVTRALAGGKGDPRQAVAQACGLTEDPATLDRLAWLGIFDDAPLPAGSETRADLICSLMTTRMDYRPGERDMVVLFHTFESAYPDGTAQTITSTFVAYGDPEGDTAMARTVSLPAAIATKRILDGTITLTGVHTPVDPMIYGPVLGELEALGLACRDVFGERRLITHAHTPEPARSSRG